jgi:hypothetical protein
MAQVNRHDFGAQSLCRGGKHLNPATLAADPMRRGDDQATSINKGAAALNLAFEHDYK